MNFSVLVAASTICLIASVLPAHAQYRAVKVAPTENRGTWQGWGTSLAWWANAVGNKNYESVYADLFFSRKTVPFLDEELPGLGLNIARYNIGGGGATDGVGATFGENQEAVSPELRWARDIKGFWLDGDKTDADSDGWDWSRDAAQRSMLQAAVQRGVDHVELFSNAPMWWMNDSKSSAGGNIEAQYHDDFAFYLATVAKYARDKWKVPVTSVEPFNEPSAGWWKYPKDQEGSNIDLAAQADILGKLRAQLDEKGLENIVISASDENSIDAATKTYDYFKQRNVADVIDQVNVHSYRGLEAFRDNTKRVKLRETVGDKPLWMSEFGDSEGGGMKMAQTIMEDINYVRPTAWLTWQALSAGSPWGLVNARYGADARDQETGIPKMAHTKYYVFAQFTRFLRPGFQIIGSSDDNSIVAYDKVRRQLTLITLNYTDAQIIEYDLSNLKKVGLSGQITSTVQVLSKERDKNSDFQIAPLFVNNGRLRVRALPNSIYSIVINGVEL